MEEEEQQNTILPLHVSRVEQPLATINRSYTFLNVIALVALIWYRVSWLATGNMGSKTLTWTLTFASELLLAFVWVLSQPSRWNPLVRTVFPDRISQKFTDEKLPAIDVFICTADPVKEPPMQVMNTVISAMSLDYPVEKLSVYLSDDAGSPLTRYALVQASAFARSWLPFCKMNGIETRCPESYFSAACDCKSSDEFMEEQEKIKLLYENCKESVEKAGESGKFTGYESSEKKGEGYPPMIEIIFDGGVDLANDEDHNKIPKLVYIAREKKQGHHHHFKAGALNVLLRVSSIMSNAPLILVLDCDMHASNPSSARQALCFLLDTQISHSLAFVQFPQAFHNTSKNDIYDGQLSLIFKTMWKGLDGLKGPIMSGTGFYVKRQALYGSRPGISSKDLRSTDPLQSRRSFGSSNELLASICGDDHRRHKTPSNALLQEAFLLAACTYEEDTEWGTEVGFLYYSVVEDFLTGFFLHCRGWISILCSPSRPSFLGNAPIVLSDTLVQNKRWASGLLAVGVSKFCPLIYGFGKTTVLQSMCYGFFALRPIYSLSMIYLASIPQLCLINNISLYPKVTDPCFVIFSFLFLSSYSQNLMEVVQSGGSTKKWWNEQRVWMIRCTSSFFFAVLGVGMNLIGMREIGFELTNKVVDEGKFKRYKKEEFDFEGLSRLFVPVMTLALINIAAFIAGLRRVILDNSCDRMFAQLFLSFFISISSYPLYKGIVTRKDEGRVPASIIVLSLIISVIFLYLGSIVLVS